MNKCLMLLPAKNIADNKIVRIPDDYDHKDALRHATSLIATVEEQDPDYQWEDIAATLEDHGFEIMDFMIGPSLD